MESLKWLQDEDEDGNTTWTADSPYTDNGDAFQFKLVPVLRNNRIEWESRSDDECGGDLGGPWQTLDKAKEACEEANDTINQTLLDSI